MLCFSKKNYLSSILKSFWGFPVGLPLVSGLITLRDTIKLVEKSFPKLFDCQIKASF